MIDGKGIYGFIFHYACLFALTGSAFFIFLLLSVQKKLDFSEEPKYQMLEEDEPP